MSGRGPGQRAGLQRSSVVAAARALVEAGGVSAVSMRSVAKRLGVTPNALYSHVPDKGALVDLVLDDLLVEVPRPATDALELLDEDQAAAALRELLLATFDALAAAPGLVGVALARQGSRGEAAVRLGEVMDALLERTGVTGDVSQARQVLIVHVIGFAAFAVPATSVQGRPPMAPSQVRIMLAESTRWLLLGMQG